VSSKQSIDQDLARQRLSALLDERLEELTRSLRQIVTETAPSPDLGPVVRFATHAERSTDQVAILDRLVEEAALTAQRIILFIVKGATLRGWAARGMPGSFTPKSLSWRVTPEDLLGQAIETAAAVTGDPGVRPGDGRLAAALGNDAPFAMLAAPLWVRDRVAAVLYADAAPGGTWQPNATVVMTSLAALGLEALPYRARHPRPVEAPRIVAPVETPEAPAPEPGAATMSIAGGEKEPGRPDTESEEEPDPEQAALHEEARRFAALLASEIVLYNEKQLEEGRRNKDLYERLKDDIDRSYRMFEQRISSKLSGATRHFKEEIVRALANGDESAIRLPWD